MKTYRVKSIFGPTLQGEGTHAGTCVLFLRFAGCNRWSGLEKDRENSFCRFCDTDFRGGARLTGDQIVDKLKSLHGPKRVVITGGEPTLQLDTELLSLLKQNEFEVHLETNGSRELGSLRELIHHVTLSPKQSREETKLEACDDLKLLYPLPDTPVTMENFDSFPSKRKFLQPVMDKNYDAHLRATIGRIYGNPEWRLSIQTHKIVGVE
jgi:7-carboxy-7-deazaguanine synthase